MRQIAHLPEISGIPGDYWEWRKGVMRHRLLMYRETSDTHPQSKTNRQREVDRCAKDRLYMAAVYGTIYESRQDEDDSGRERGGYIPFIPYFFQVELWDQFDKIMRTRGSGGDLIVPKSRDMGVSNTGVFWMTTKWMVETPFQGRIGSRNEDLVDERGNPDSLFWKIDTFLQGMPEWLLQAFAPGFSWKKHRQVLKIVNPRNGNAMVGESTTANLGRGGRATVIFYDEAAFMDNFDKIWTAGRSSTRHRIAVSTVNTDNGLTFFNLHRGKGGYKQPSIFEIPWDAHPTHTEKWLRDEIQRDSIEGVKREVLMDYFSGLSEWTYPESLSKEVGQYPYEPFMGPVYGAIDDGWDDDWHMHLIQYNLKTGRFRVIASYWNSHKKTDWYGALMTGVPRSDMPWEQREIDFVKVVNLAGGITWVGDPHITNGEQVSGSSVFEHLYKEHGITVFYDHTNRGENDRRHSLSYLLSRIDFHDGPGVAYALECLQNNKFRKAKVGQGTVTQQKKALHDWTSHAVSAFEWWAINFDQIKSRVGKRIEWEGSDNNSHLEEVDGPILHRTTERT